MVQAYTSNWMGSLVASLLSWTSGIVSRGGRSSTGHGRSRVSHGCRKSKIHVVPVSDLQR